MGTLTIGKLRARLDELAGGWSEEDEKCLGAFNDITVYTDWFQKPAEDGLYYYAGVGPAKLLEHWELGFIFVQDGPIIRESKL